MYHTDSVLLNRTILLSVIIVCVATSFCHTAITVNGFSIKGVLAQAKKRALIVRATVRKNIEMGKEIDE